MRISHKYKFVFLSNPQSASTSVREMLEPWSDILGGYEFPFHYHASARNLKATFAEQGWDWNAYYKFSTLRNPWEKMLARYFYGLRDPHSQWHESAKNLSFDGFLRDPFVQDKSLNTNFHHFLEDTDGNQLVDNVISLENLEVGLKEVFQHLQLDWPGMLRVNHANNKRPHYSAWYSDEGRRIVKELHLRDIQLYGYCYQPEQQV